MKRVLALYHLIVCSSDFLHIMQFVYDAYEYFYLHDAFEMVWDKNTPYCPDMEIPEQYVFDCVRNYCRNIERTFMECNVIDITIDNENNVSEVFNMLRYLKVLHFYNS